MINVNKDNIFKAFLTGLFSCITIGALTLLTYKTSLGLFLMTSFGSSMVLLYGFPENPFAQPKNIVLGHLLSALIGILFATFFETSFILFPTKKKIVCCSYKPSMILGS